MGYFVESEQESVRYVPTIAAGTLIPTIAEVNAGTDITDDAQTVNGFSARASNVEVQTLKGGFVPKISGREVAEDSSIVFAEQHTFALNTIKAALAKGLTGFIVWSRYTKTIIATTKVDVFPIKISGNNRTRTAENRDAQFIVDFAITSTPVYDVAVAA